MCDRRRKCGRFFDPNSALPQKLFFRRQNPSDVTDDIAADDIEEIIIDGIDNQSRLYSRDLFTRNG